MSNTKSLIVFLSLLFGLITNSEVFSQQAPPPKSGKRVMVTVSAEEPLKSSIISYITRELRSLGDVIIVYAKPTWEIDIVAIYARDLSGRKTGVILSTVVLGKPSMTESSIEIIVPEVETYKKKLLNTMIEPLHAYGQHFVNIGPTDKLRGICEDVVATFDSGTLEPARRTKQELLDLIKKSKNQ